MKLFGSILLACLALAPVASAAPAPATFQVGTATKSLSPNPGEPVYAGGFGYSPPITEERDPIEVRAFYISNGSKAVAFAVLDAQAMFASYQEDAALGLTGIRNEAAGQISELAGAPAMQQGDIIVQATHSHAAPTLEGIWGPVPPNYLRKVHNQARDAIVEAARNAQAAHLQFGTFDAPWLNNIDLDQTDSYTGWAQDGQVSVLRAVTPSGGSVGSFVNVPAHPDIACGSCSSKLSADYFGFVRTALDERLGGTNLVGGATLGREETPLQVDGFEASDFFGGVVTSIAGRMMADGHWITSNKLASTESFINVPATNPLLLALNTAWKLPDEQKQQMADASGQYPIDRSMDPPYVTGTVIGTYLTAIRVGDVAYTSMPGESFPEIRYGIEKAVTGADAVVALAKAQDDWGYFYPAWVFPFTAFYDTDHHIYNVAPHAGDQIIKDQTENVGKLGFPVDIGVGMPLPTRFQQALRPGVQGLASPTWADAGPSGTARVTFEAIFNGSKSGVGPVDTGGSPPMNADKIRWNFGDGTTGQSGSGQRFPHDYTPGTYTVNLSATDTSGKTATWQLVVRVFPQLKPQITAEQTGPDTWAFTGDASGGDGRNLAFRWSFSDGEKAEGNTVEHTFPANATPSATLTVADGTTMTANAVWTP